MRSLNFFFKRSSRNLFVQRFTPKSIFVPMGVKTFINILKLLFDKPQMNFLSILPHTHDSTAPKYTSSLWEANDESIYGILNKFHWIFDLTDLHCIVWLNEAIFIAQTKFDWRKRMLNELIDDSFEYFRIEAIKSVFTL